MNEKKLTELYINEIENSAPDFDAIWDKIETNLEPKENAVKITPKKSYLKPFMAVAACAVCVIGASVVLNTSDNITTESTEPSVQQNSLAVTDGDNVENESVGAVPEAENSVNSADDKMSYETLLSYEDLNFTSYSETVIACSGKPNGADYFIEDTVLSSADCIIRGIITRVYQSENGESLCYEMEIKESCPETTEKTVVIQSNSPYKMKRGREYLIPAAKTAENYRTVFDNIPQIEYTADGGFVYYNGWSTLDNDSSADLIYPQKTVDDFFYDRMKFSYSGDISPLIEKFRYLKAL